MALTYDQLAADVPVILMAQNRTLADNFGIVMRQAEDEIIQRLDRDAFRAVLSPSVQVTPTEFHIDLSTYAPAVLEVRSMRLDMGDTDINLERRDVERMRMVFGPYDQGPPRFYAEADEPLRYRVFPIPDTTYVVTISANVEPLRLSTVVQQSLLSRSWPRLLEAAVLKYGARFMRNPADEARYDGAFQAALDDANAQLRRRRRDETNAAPNSV